MATKLTVLLGRNGDVLAGLPLLLDAKSKGEKRVLMISEEYAALMDGLSLDRILWRGDWRDVKAAYTVAKRDWEVVNVLQQYSRDGWPVAQGTSSFVRDMYRLERKLPLFPLPLTFDRRDAQREARLTASLPADKPLVLVATQGLSSPFPHADALLNLIEGCFPQALVLDMSVVRGERLYDLLALFERATCLVTVDSALLHLAQATPTLPVIALIADKPTSWHGSPEYAGQRLRVRYGDYPKRSGEIVEALGACLLAPPAVGGRPAPAPGSAGELGA